MVCGLWVAVYYRGMCFLIEFIFYYSAFLNGCPNFKNNKVLN